MLLRRMIEHVKAQNWTAVALDFVIVVVGVFVGIQVSNWNDARADRIEERRILERLHDQLVNAQSVQTALGEYTGESLAALSTAREILFDFSDRKTLTPLECEAIGASYVVATSGPNLPMLEELGATGGLALIKDEAVVNAVANLALFTKAEAALIADTQPTRVALATLFPDLLTVDLKPDENVSGAMPEIGAYDSTFRCDVQGMRENQAFLNAMGTNATNVLTVFEIGTSPKIEAMGKLRKAVEAALGIDDREAS
ncbi:MAG: hypothetical protein AAFW81_01095 [Pseudomonadota bacterium]